jgi:antitoxin ChpS
MLVIQNHPHRAGSHLRRELVRCPACHGSTFSRVGASGKPGAVHLEVDAQVTLSVERGKLAAEPPGSRRKRYSMMKLLKGQAGMKHLTAEVAWVQEGEPVGREIG